MKKKVATPEDRLCRIFEVALAKMSPERAKRVMDEICEIREGLPAETLNKEEKAP